MSVFGHTPRRARFRSAAAALAVVGALTIAGCGGGSTPAPAATATAAAPSTATSTAPVDASTGTGTGTGDCGEATAAAIARGLTDFGSFTVTNEGGCHDATIVTTLTKADVAKALAICVAAAAIGYPAGDISSVTVTGANDVELSIGVKGQDCIGEP